MIYIHQVLNLEYGLAKIHKGLEDGITSFWSILSVIETPIYRNGHLHGCVGCKRNSRQGKVQGIKCETTMVYQNEM